MDSGESNNASNAQAETEKPLFKKPLLIGKVGKFPKKVVKKGAEQKAESGLEKNSVDVQNEKINEGEVSVNTNEDIVEEKQLPLPYKEPAWSGLPVSEGKHYKLEVLKLGSIIETIDLMGKPYWVFGRLNNCDVSMAHPTISRYHAILQYRSIESDDEPKGFYLYDLSSTHGTFLNKNKLKPRTYVKMYVGHLLKLGLSSRSYLLTGPENDTEEESELTVTELKKQREENLIKRKEAEEEAIRKQEEEKEAIRKKLEERGIDWGLGEDADEDTDLTENPFAQITNEELYLDDPKKALRGFMEREGYDFEYDCSEQGLGQFLCKVELPIDDDHGRPIVAEVLHKGKKKGAVLQCALEACRILDRYGLLRQATHESRKRKAKNWEENDYYDSDEDIFLDRTGTVEKKRENRMKAKVPAKAETYQSLLEKEVALRKEINNIENLLQTSSKTASATDSSVDEDPLDHYMKELKQMKLDKQAITKLKSDLSKLKQDLANVVKLANIAKPTDLPILNETSKNVTTDKPQKNKLPIFGKRLKVKVQIPERRTNINTDIDEDEEENEEEEEDVAMTSGQNKDDKGNVQDEFKLAKVIRKEVPTLQIKIRKNALSDSEKLQAEFSKIDTSFKMIFPLMSSESEQQLKIIWSQLKSLDPEYSETEKEKVINSFLNYANSYNVTTVVDAFTKEIDSLSDMLKSIGTSDDIIKVAEKLIRLAKEITLSVNRIDQNDEAKEPEDSTLDEASSELDFEKKKKKNQRRMQHRQEKAEIEKQKGYEEDAAKEDYNMWVPPAGQTGDGRTSLNEKYGY
ncbi:hypothetical protein Trydic_g6228 [Trypoxylus dichotomus]